MRRRRRASDKPIDLFPFIAILACVIGVLTLLIAGLSLGELEAETSGRDFVLLTRATAADRLEIERMRRQAQDRRVHGARIRHATEELERRAAAAREAAALQERRDASAARAQEAARKRDDLQREHDRLEGRIDGLEREAQGYRRQAAARGKIQLRGPKARPGQARLEPRFVECRETTIVLDADAPERDRKTIPTERIPSSPHLHELLGEVRRKAGGIVILLVREGGVETHDHMVGLLEAASVRHGVLPVPSALDIDYSALKGSGN